MTIKFIIPFLPAFCIIFSGLIHVIAYFWVIRIFRKHKKGLSFILKSFEDHQEIIQLQDQIIRRQDLIIAHQAKHIHFIKNNIDSTKDDITS